MKNRFVKLGVLPSFALSALSVAISAQAQDDEFFKPVLEEVVVVGRLKSSAENLVMDRLEQEVAVDFLGSEFIGRVGDSTVAAALRRVPGITLIDDKYVFVRGLGERYSNTLLNGAVIPSPDLSRSVIPLDIFPTSVVESLAVQKVHSSDMPAAFGGGSVDIITKSIPDALVFNVELGTGMNTESDGDFLSYAGGGDDDWGVDDGTRALSGKIKRALDQYQGSFDDATILADLRETNPDATTADAEAINRDLALGLYRDLTVKEVSGDQDLSAEVNLGNRFYFGDSEEQEFGFLAGYAYDRSWRSKESFESSVNGDEISVRRQSTMNVSITANLGMGFRLNEDHSVETMTLFLRNTDDKVTQSDDYDTIRTYDGNGDSYRSYRLRYEEREMLVNQISGEHKLGEVTLDALGFDSLRFLQDSKFTWYYSKSKANTDIPSEVKIDVDHYVGPPAQDLVTANKSAASYRFSELEDNVESYGWEVQVPFSSMDWQVNLSAGSEYWQKARAYKQLQFGLGTVSAPDSARSGDFSDVFSDENILNEAYDYAINVTSNAQSYIAANRVDAYYGKFDVTWQDTWRFVAGMRYEDYQQVGLAWAPLDYTGSQLISNEDQGQDAIVAELQDATFQDDDVFTSVAATYMRPGFWAEDFQLRFGYSETTVRPDLREIVASNYIDPVTNYLVVGNPDVVPAQFKNYDVRAEWFFSNSDNLTVSAFYKDITDPIEFFQGAGFEGVTELQIVNAESGSIFGVEAEFMKNLGDFHDVMMPFFLQGNVTLLDTELVAGSQANAPTNAKRDMAGASKHVVNLILGYDSPNEMHAATLSYNVFGERLYFAGRLGQPDAYEQPFNSLDATYSYYPTEALTVKLKVKNILDEDVEIKQGSTTTYLQSPGQSFSASIQYSF